MKKIAILFALFSLIFVSCEKEETPEDKIEKQFLNIEKNAKIAKVDQLSMLRAYAFPLNHLIIEFADGKRVCIAFVYYDFEPYEGMKVPKYSVYKYSPEEAFEVVTENGTISMESQLKYIASSILPKQVSFADSDLRGLFSKEGVVEEVFYMGIRHALTWDISSRLVPIETFFVRIGGALYYLPIDQESDKQSVKNIQVGDRVEFNTMLICKSRLSSINKMK
ncbi:MAG: hypothetical protein ACK5N8_07480 [Alphaproteobacteria bacterium]